LLQCLLQLRQLSLSVQLMHRQMRAVLVTHMAQAVTHTKRSWK